MCEATLGLRELAAFIVRVRVEALLFDQTVEVLRCVCSLQKEALHVVRCEEKKSAVSFFFVVVSVRVDVSGIR